MADPALQAKACWNSGELEKRADHSVLRDGVGIRLHDLPLQLDALGGAAVLSPGDEELLLGAEAVDHRDRVALHRPLERPVRHAHAGEIADRLAEDLLAPGR